VADAIAQYTAARKASANISDSDLSSLVSANVIAEAIDRQTAALNANAAATQNLAQEIYESNMFDDEDYEEDDHEIDEDRDRQLRDRLGE